MPLLTIPVTLKKKVCRPGEYDNNSPVMKHFLSHFTLLIFVLLVSKPIYAQVIIQEPAIVNIRHNRTTVEWESSVPTKGKIEFGKTPKLGRFVTIKSYAKGHATQIGNLKPNTKYFFKIVAKDKRGQVSHSKLYAFVTDQRSSPEADQKLKILSPPQVTQFSPRKVIISWETNKPSVSFITYGFKKNRKPHVVVNESDTTSHIVTLSNLVPNSLYYYQVTSRTSSRERTQSSYGSFRTLKAPKNVTLPTINRGPSVAVRLAHQANIEFSTDRPCKTFITWGISPVEKHQTRKTVSRSLRKDHTIKLKGLKKGQRYYYIVHLEDAQGRKNKSEIFTIKSEKFD